MNGRSTDHERGAPRPVVRFYNTVEPVISLFRIVGEGLVAAGYQVEIVVTAGEYRVGGEALADWAHRTGVRLVRVPGLSAYPRGAFRKALLAAYYSTFAFCHALFARSAALNVFMTQPPVFFAVGWVLRRLRRQPFACIVMDVYPDVLVAFGKLRAGSATHRVLHSIAYGALKRADAVVSIGRCMSTTLERAGVPAALIHLVPNWAEPWLVTADDPTAPQRQRPILGELGLADAFVLLYSGNMGAAHTFDELVGAAERLRDDPHVRFLVVGQGVRRQAFVAQVAARGLVNVTVLPYQEQSRAASLMNEVDAHLVTQLPGFEGLVVPSKAYSALATGKPLVYVGRDDGEIARMIVEESVGIVLPAGVPAQLADAVARLAANVEERRAMGRRASALACGRYGQRRAREQYTALIGRLAGPPSRATRQ